jgi:hypothetical protein
MSKPQKSPKVKLSQAQINAYMQKVRRIIEVGTRVEFALERQDRDAYHEYKTRWLEVVATFADHGEHLERKLHNAAEVLFQVEEPPMWRNG